MIKKFLCFVIFSFELQLHGSSFKESPVFTIICQENEFLSKGSWKYRGQTVQAVINKNRKLGETCQETFSRLSVAPDSTPTEFVAVSSRQVRIPKLRLPIARRG